MHGLGPDDLSITDAAIRKIIADYTREAGLRNLERGDRRRSAGSRPAGVPRASANPSRSNPSDIADLLGPSRFFRELADRTGIPGVSTGLAWTPTGGEILFIEATGMPGKGVLTLTGLLGDSMRKAPRPRSATCAAMPSSWPSTSRGSPRPTCTSTCPAAPSPRMGRRPAWRSPPR